MTDCRVGEFRLLFEEGGKLCQLFLPGRGPVLHETDYCFDLRDGRTFHPGGWDECFPTIEPHSSGPLMGCLIGKTPEFVEGIQSIEQVWRLDRCTAKRRFSLRADNKLELLFTVINHSADPIEFLWASHALFSLENLTGATFPDATAINDFSLDGTASKSFVPADGPIRLVKQTGGFALNTDQPWWGVWFNRGGWPDAQPAGFGCLGIEATNTASDLPQKTFLLPNESFSGHVWLEL